MRSSAAPIPVPFCVIVAPSGAGKSTLVQGALGELGDLAGYVVSDTSRAARAGETHGTHYFFRTGAEFEALRGPEAPAGSGRYPESAYLEWAPVHGNYYGTRRAEVARQRAAGRLPFREMDIQGARLVRAAGEPMAWVHVLPPDAATLVARLDGRGTETPSSRERRLHTAVAETEAATEADYVVVNGDRAQATAEMTRLLAALARGERPEVTALQRASWDATAANVAQGLRAMGFGGPAVAPVAARGLKAAR